MTNMVNTQQTAIAPAKKPRGENQLPKCSAEKVGGGFCSQHVVPGFTRCLWHEPALAERAAIARRQGGLSHTHQLVYAKDRVSAVSLKSVANTRELLERLATDMLTGELGVNVGRAVKEIVEVGIRLADLEMAAEIASLQQELAAWRRER
jgi:hypothetical protein